MRFIDPQDVCRVQHDVKQQDRAEKPEEAVGDYGHPKHRVLPHPPYFLEQLLNQDVHSIYRPNDVSRRLGEQRKFFWSRSALNNMQPARNASALFIGLPLARMS